MQKEKILVLNKDESIIEFLIGKEALYHYTNYDIALTKILNHKQLKFSNFDSLSDIREKIIHFQFVSGRIKNTNEDINSKINFGFDENSIKLKEEKEKYRILCFSSNSKIIIDDRYENIYSHAFCIDTLWDRFAGSYTGVCLIFDKQEFLKDEADFELIPIKYCTDVLNRNNSVNLDNSEEEVKNNIKNKITSKSKGYASEQECRCITKLNVEDEFVDITMKLKGIILGPLFPEIYLDTIKKICKEWGDNKILLFKYIIENKIFLNI